MIKNSPFTLSVVSGLDKNGADLGLILAIYDDNLSGALKYLERGANPSLFFAAALNYQKSSKGFELLRLNALELALHLCVNPKIARALTERSLVRDMGPSCVSRAIANRVNPNPIAIGSELNASSDRVYQWGKRDPTAHAHTLLAMLALIPLSEAPWIDLASVSSLEPVMSQYILEVGKRDADAPFLTQALAACASHNRQQAARAILSVGGSSVDLEPARVEADTARDQAFKDQLSRPIHAYAITAGQKEWIDQRLQEADKSWLNLSAPFSLAWGPLAAALEFDKRSPERAGLAQQLIDHGASANAVCQSASFAQSVSAERPISLLAERAIRNDIEGVKLLLRAGASIASINERGPFSKGNGSALGEVCARGNRSMAELLLSAGADPRAISSGQLRAIAKTDPEIRAWLGSESALSLFARGVKSAASRVLPSKSRSAPELTPAAQDASATPALNVSPALRLMDNAELSDELLSKGYAASRLAQEIAPFGRLPACAADAPALKRLWENNIPLFLQRLLEIPSEDRHSPGADGGPSPARLFEAMIDTAHDSMVLMRARALSSARDRLDVEAAVIADSAGRSLESFKTMIDRSESRATPSLPNLPQEERIGFLTPPAHL